MYKRLLLNTFLIVYLWFTFWGLVFTAVRFEASGVSRIARYSYGMMAPYQAVQLENSGILAEGQLPDGSWEKIDLAPYYPMLTGERNVREFLAMYEFRKRDAERAEQSQRLYAERLLMLEQEKGKTYTAVRISWETWPTWVSGFEDGRQPGLSSAEFLVSTNEK